MVFSVYNEKGGVGKTSLVVNMASVLAKYYGARVLVVDCDKQCNSSQYLLGNTSTYLQDSVQNEINHGWMDLVDGQECVLYSAEMITRGGSKPKKVGIDVLCSCKHLAKVNLSSDATERIEEALRIVVSQYDYVICDLPAYFGISSIAELAMRITDRVIVPMLADSVSLDGYSDLLDTINHFRNSGINEEIGVGGIVLNRYETRQGLDQYLLDSMTEQYGTAFVPHPIHKSSIVSDALWEQRPVPFYRPTSRVARDYEAVVKYIIQ